MRVKFGQESYNYDENFMKVSQFAFNNNILDLDEVNDKKTA